MLRSLEPATGIGPALPAWKAGALPLSYTDGWCREQIPPTPGCRSFPAVIFKEEDRRGFWLPRVEPLVGFEPTACWLQISCSTAELQRRILRCRSQYPWHGLSPLQATHRPGTAAPPVPLQLSIVVCPRPAMPDPSQGYHGTFQPCVCAIDRIRSSLNSRASRSNNYVCHLHAAVLHHLQQEPFLPCLSFQRRAGHSAL